MFTGSRIFALLIGVNLYQNTEYSDLQNAVADADSFEQFLKNGLGVPTSRIQNLRDEEATRANIIAAFRALKDNPLIEYDDPILIFFAGHGARGEKPETWIDWASTQSQIEYICPTDIGCRNQDSPKEEDIHINGIPDRTICVLLHELFVTKGDNITLVLDCCSAGGMNRSIDVEGLIARQINNPPPISDQCDYDIWCNHNGSRAAFVMEGLSGRHHESHILLAACGRDQTAYEDPRIGQGLFTSSLLKILKYHSPNELTYTSLMHRLKLPKWQRPHCEGQNVHRRLFDKNSPGADPSLVLCWTQNNGALMLNAGAAQGFVIGTKFSIHKTNLLSESNTSMGVYVLISLEPVFSVLSFASGSKPFTLPSICYAKEIERGPGDKFVIYSNDKGWLEGILSYEDEGMLGAEIVEDAEGSHLRIYTDGNRVSFERSDCLAAPHIGQKLPHLMFAHDEEGIRNVVKCAVHYQRHLIRTGQDFNNVWMEFRELHPVHSDMWLSPKGPDLFAQEPTIITIDDPELRYGLTIYNRTDLGLYPYLFYFDPSNLEIVEWYTSPFGAGTESYSSTVDEPLPPRSKFTIGFGDGGASPWRFSLNDGEDVDVGFFKLFLTTSPGNFATIPQPTPFVAPGSRHGMAYKKPLLPNQELWGTKLATVVQNRPSY